MTIEDAIGKACEHFLENFQSAADIQPLFERYASEELELTGDDVKEFALYALTGLKVRNHKEAEQFYRFYTWYYINKVVPLPNA
jgi:hypothetical protein